MKSEILTSIDDIGMFRDENRFRGQTIIVLKEDGLR